MINKFEHSIYIGVHKYTHIYILIVFLNKKLVCKPNGKQLKNWLVKVRPSVFIFYNRGRVWGSVLFVLIYSKKLSRRNVLFFIVVTVLGIGSLNSMNICWRTESSQSSRGLMKASIWVETTSFLSYYF